VRVGRSFFARDNGEEDNRTPRVSVDMIDIV